MARQLEAMGKEVKMLAIFDTDADNCREMEPWYIILPKVARRYMPKFLGGKKSFFKQLNDKINEKKMTVNERLGLKEKTESDEYYALLESIVKKYFEALHKYKVTPVNFDIHLFKADFNDHYNNDEVYLGWKKYTSKEVKRYLVPGNHLTMMIQPNVAELGKAVQDALSKIG
jgi:thioesterase domain-containing protein